MTMIHEYENSAADLSAFTRYMAQRTCGTRLRVLRFGPALALAFAGAVLWSINRDGALAFSLAIGSAMFPIFFALFHRRSMNSAVDHMLRSAPAESVLCRHQLVLEDSGLLEKTAVSENRTNWAAIGEVMQSETHVFVFVGPGMAHVIPKASFANAEAMNSFVQEVERRRARVAETAPAT